MSGQIIKRTPFGTEVKLELVRRGMTGRDFAKSIGIKESTLCDVMAGRNKSEATMRKIIEGLGLSNYGPQ
ncbi:helix-turn-helix domain-containing protein [Lacrimispora sp. 210928-DFI.3.58]|uniref:helix-turn-helix domain-containing protein n=1 Tax=Lacrimispora sp. 210928-DFI.3.58 TaxID=2883214 RepID=UPI001D06D666|nr:helix-turn-helix domain-containing protein [Lacrimispora sp. 210928-DFI.3.58]MCB7317322.1 helix-turn-helix domain-containing protein [Lacrimispora sp. 210928-DFI.3.58]